jgi:hypothetical protein
MEKKIMCPSSSCEEGSTLLGIIQGDGKVSFLSQKLIVNEEFIQLSTNGDILKRDLGLVIVVLTLLVNNGQENVAVLLTVSLKI